MRAGFTLAEVIIVVIIIGILATFAMPQYVKIQEKGLDNEAKANLVLIQAAENLYNTESNVFYGSADHAELNTNLNLSLPPTDMGEQKWNYSTQVTAAVGVNPATVCAQAERNVSSNKRYWKIMDTDNAPSAVAYPSCP